MNLEFHPVTRTLPAIDSWVINLLSIGQGKSGRVPGQYLSKFYIADVEQFLQQELDEPAVLFGQSAGGMVALGTTLIALPHFFLDFKPYWRLFARVHHILPGE
jgi:pimeloyl-ACP methyl ester carboxylesterase